MARYPQRIASSSEGEESSEEKGKSSKSSKYKKFKKPPRSKPPRQQQAQSEVPSSSRRSTRAKTSAATSALEDPREGTSAGTAIQADSSTPVGVVKTRIGRVSKPVPSRQLKVPSPKRRSKKDDTSKKRKGGTDGKSVARFKSMELELDSEWKGKKVSEWLAKGYQFFYENCRVIPIGKKWKKFKNSDDEGWHILCKSDLYEVGLKDITLEPKQFDELSDYDDTNSDIDPIPSYEARPPVLVLNGCPYCPPEKVHPFSTKAIYRKHVRKTHRLIFEKDPMWRDGRYKIPTDPNAPDPGMVNRNLPECATDSEWDPADDKDTSDEEIEYDMGNEQIFGGYSEDEAQDNYDDEQLNRATFKGGDGDKKDGDGDGSSSSRDDDGDNQPPQESLEKKKVDKGKGLDRTKKVVIKPKKAETAKEKARREHNDREREQIVAQKRLEYEKLMKTKEEFEDHLKRLKKVILKDGKDLKAEERQLKKEKATRKRKRSSHISESEEEEDEEEQEEDAPPPPPKRKLRKKPPVVEFTSGSESENTRKMGEGSSDTEIGSDVVFVDEVKGDGTIKVKPEDETEVPVKKKTRIESNSVAPLEVLHTPNIVLVFNLGD